MTTANVLYDFEAQNAGEISVTAGESIKIVRQDAGDGWCEGINKYGDQGLLPVDYIEVKSAGPPSAPPAMALPPLPAGYGAPSAAPPPMAMAPARQQSNDSWGQPEHVTSTTAGYPALQQQSSAAGVSNDDFDGWDSDDDKGRAAPPAKPAAPPANQQHLGTTLAAPVRSTSSVSDWDDSDNEGEGEESTGGGGAPQSSYQPPSRPTGGPSLSAQRSSQMGDSSSVMSSSGRPATSVRRNINRFSNFVKSGVEAFVLGEAKVSSQPMERHQIVLNGPEIVWACIVEPYTTIVDKPKKESKLKGLKSFIAYQITPSMTGIQVSRRYKHFDWLFERLAAKYTLTPIPPLPEKQVSGKFEDELIEHRKQILQLWADKICRHPLLCQSRAWQHFMTCTDEKEWKAGKRKAEKDEYTGGNFFLSVAVPERQLDLVDCENRVESFARMSKSLDESVRQVYERAGGLGKQMSAVYKKDYQKLGLAFDNLAISFLMDDSKANESIQRAIGTTAACYHKIGDLFERQPRNDMEPMMDALYAYKGMLSSVPDIIQVHRSAVSKLKDQEASSADGKAVRQRVDVIGYVTLAEITHFHTERRIDFKHTIADMLRQQVDFQKKITHELERALEEMERA